MLKEGDKCPQCQFGNMLESDQRDDDGNPIYLTCSECETVQLTYVPLSHQDTFHSDSAKYKGFFGGYGSGKTRTGAEEVTQHILSTPNGMTLIGAETKPQLDQTAKDMFFKVFPDFMVEDYWKQKEMVLCTNGHIVLFRPLDDEGKLRSLNLTCFWIEEASEVKYDIFVQLQTRLRNKATKHHQGILTSNPDMGWIKTEFLLKAARIENAERKYLQLPDDINPAFSVHIAPTHLNTYLPPDYVETTAKGKPEWWVKRFLFGSFEHTDGQVYPMFADLIIPSFSIPKQWERLTASDFGLRDPTVMLAGAIDPKEGVVHIYVEHYENGKSIKYHAEQMKKKILNDIPQGRLRHMVADPKGKAKSEKDFRSTYDYYAEYDIYFDPAINKIEDGILKAFSYMEMGKVKIHDCCVNTIREGVNYKYPKQDLMSDKNPTEKPVDKDNHAMDCFIKDTLIETPNGQVPIQFVRKGDFVLTRDGYKRVIASGIANVHANTIQVDFANGTSLIGTKDHLIWTENRGFVTLDSLRYSDIIRVSEYWEDSEWLEWKHKYITAKHTEGILKLKGHQIGTIIDYLLQRGILNTFTGKCMKIISDRFPKVGTFTTKTVILTTMFPKILKRLVQRTMLDFMRPIKNMTTNTLLESNHSQKNGMVQKKGINGTVTMLKRFLNKGSFKRKPVNIVEKRTKRKTWVNLSSVPITVEQQTGANVESIMKPVNANIAEIRSRSTSMLRKSIAPMNVVYNLTVEGIPEFYANGILVHNCLKYMIAELPDDPTQLVNLSYNRNDYYGNQNDDNSWLPHALQEEPQEDYGDWASFY